MNITYNFNQDHDEAPDPPFPSKKVLQVKKEVTLSYDGDKLPRLQKMLDYRKSCEKREKLQIEPFLFIIPPIYCIVQCSHSTLVKKKRIACVLFAFIAFPRVLSSNTFHLILWYRIKVHSCSYLSPSHMNSLRFDMHKLLSKVHQPNLKPFKETHTHLTLDCLLKMPKKA